LATLFGTPDRGSEKSLQLFSILIGRAYRSTFFLYRETLTICARHGFSENISDVRKTL